MEFLEFKGKTKDEALMQASVELGVPSTDLEYEVISEETKGFLGIGSKPCIIKARKKKTFLDDVKEYLDSLFKAMDIQTEIQMDFDEEENVIIAKIVKDENGEDEYVDPTDEEFEKVQAVYNELCDAEEAE